MFSLCSCRQVQQAHRARVVAVDRDRQGVRGDHPASTGRVVKGPDSDDRVPVLRITAGLGQRSPPAHGAAPATRSIFVVPVRSGIVETKASAQAKQSDTPPMAHCRAVSAFVGRRERGSAGTRPMAQLDAAAVDSRIPQVREGIALMGAKTRALRVHARKL